MGTGYMAAPTPQLMVPALSISLVNGVGIPLPPQFTTPDVAVGQQVSFTLPFLVVPDFGPYTVQFSVHVIKLTSHAYTLSGVALFNTTDGKSGMAHYDNVPILASGDPVPTSLDLNIGGGTLFINDAGYLASDPAALNWVADGIAKLTVIRTA